MHKESRMKSPVVREGKWLPFISVDFEIEGDLISSDLLVKCHHLDA